MYESCLIRHCKVEPKGVAHPHLIFMHAFEFNLKLLVFAVTKFLVSSATVGMQGHLARDGTWGRPKYHGWPWPATPIMTMVDHDNEKWYHSQAWLTIVMMTTVDHAFEKWHHYQAWLTMFMMTMVDHGQTMVSDHGVISQKCTQPRLDHGQNIWLNHGFFAEEV